MSKFRSALDYYLNHSFDLNKLLTFTRFYTHFANSALSTHNINAESNQEQKLAAFDKAFTPLEGLIDMNALFGHLVTKVGTKTFLDPVSKTDPIQNLIDFFTQPNV